MTRTPIERISSNDLTVLATDRGPVPMQIAAVLEFGPGAAPTFGEVAAALQERIPRVPRLRRRLLAPPPGCGRPVWIDDPEFTLSRHLVEAHPLAADERLLDAAARIACQRLPRDRPPWAAHWLPGGPDRPAALVFVAQHVLADGLGGLAVLAALADPAPGAAPDPAPWATPAPGATPPAPPPPAFPQPPPRPSELFVDAWSERLGALAAAPRTLAAAAAGLRELGLLGRRSGSGGSGGGPRERLRAPNTAFNRPTGSRRRITALSVPLEDVVEAARARRCTVNDVLLVAVAGALGTALAARGEAPGRFVVSVPVSSRGRTEAGTLGNANGVVPVEVPADPDPAVRLARVAAQSQARRTAPRGTSAGPLGVAFRALARAGAFQHFIDRQRLVNTFLSNMRGPAEPLFLAGNRITRIVPASMTPGNVGVCFTVLSYAGQLVVAVLGDPDVVPEQDRLTVLLHRELARFTG
ncbi:wax ester/triacylglycerol synthase domain-containing protein [Sinomonas soli]